MEARYVNTDLILRSERDLRSLIAALEVGDLFVVRVEAREDGLWLAVLESGTERANPEASIADLIGAVEQLPSEARAVWDVCTERRFDVGYAFEGEGSPLEVRIAPDTLRAIAATGAGLTITVYRG